MSCCRLKKKTCLQISVPIQPKTAQILPREHAEEARRERRRGVAPTTPRAQVGAFSHDALVETDDERHVLFDAAEGEARRRQAEVLLFAKEKTERP